MTNLTNCIVVFLAAVGSMVAQPEISYMLPDIGTTRMGTYIEIVAPSSKVGSFGADGMYDNSPSSAVRVECGRPSDTNTVTIGPVSVSWNGRLISTIIFVDPLARPNSADWRLLQTEFRIPIRVVTAAGLSNVDTFYVVQPWPMGDLRSETDRVLGAGRLGVRSRRGAMIVDSMQMGGLPAYTVSTDDCDPQTPGNQGYLPFVLLSQGHIYGQIGTVIDVGARGANGGPGGGGGGGGYANNLAPTNPAGGFQGGHGYTGGGPGGDNNTPVGPRSRERPGMGSGSVPTSGTDGGISLNGTPGGTSGSAHENAGGGTGHPFGRSGAGCDNNNTCVPDGGHGGGSGFREGQRGGGGGYGDDGGGTTFTGGNTAGKRHGNAAIVPLAGGSGGASGNPSGLTAKSSSGGGGGGAISIHGLHLEEFTIRANGATTSRQDVNGGGGSGGAVILGSRIDVQRFVSPQTNPGEDQGHFNPGGAGRRRVDGRVTIDGVYGGAGLDTVKNTLRRLIVRGYGNGNDAVIWLRGENTQWFPFDTIRNGGTSWQRPYVLPGTDTLYYMLVAQRIPSPSQAPFAAEPEWVMSQSGWNILRIYGPPILSAPSTFAMRTYACPGADVVDTIEIRNEGESPLDISSITLSGGSGFTIEEPTVFPDTIAPFGRRSIIVRYSRQPGHTGAQTTQITIRSNDTAAGKNPFVIDVSIAVEPFDLRYSWRGLQLGPRGDTLDYGTVCVGQQQQDNLVVRNAGASPATLLNFRSSAAGLVFTSHTLPFALPAAGVRNVSIHFTARQEGPTVVPVLLDVAECPQPDTVWIRFDGRLPRMTLVGDGQFGDVVVGSSVTRIIEVRNDGSSALAYAALAALPAPYQIVGTVPPLPATVAPGERLLIEVRYAPTSASDDTAVLRLRADATTATCADSLTIGVSGRGRQRSLALSSETLNLGVIPFCESAIDSVTVTNNGTVPVTLLYPAFITGPDASSFTITGQPTVDAVLNPGQAITYTVTFSGAIPPAGLKTASLLIRTSTNGQGGLAVALQGQRSEPQIGGARIVDVGAIPLGVPTQRRETYTNDGSIDLGLADTRTSRQPVAATLNPVGILAPNSAFELDISITPIEEGFHTDTVWVRFNAPCADSMPVIVRYSGASGRITVPNTIFFGTLSQCATGRDSIVITNPSNVEVDMINVAIEGPDASLFTVENPGVILNRTLAPSDTVKLFVRFDPRQATDGVKRASLVVRVRINNQPTRAITQLEGNRRTALTGAPPAVNFGAIDIGTTVEQRVVLVNSSSVDVNITSIRLRSGSTSPFTITPPSVPLRLPAGGSVSIPVAFAPIVDGRFDDSVVVVFDAPCPDERVVAITGLGRLNVELIVIMPQQDNIDPSTDEHRWPIRAAVASAQTPIQNATVVLDVRYVTDMFVPQRVENGSIISAVSTGGLTTLRVEIRPVASTTDTTEIGAIVGQVTLGMHDSTSIDIVDGEIILPNATPSVRPQHGFMRTTICREGGDRFVRRAGSLRMHVAPLPASDRCEVTAEVFEAGEHRLRVVDITGATVQQWRWVHRSGDPARVFDVSTGSMGSGVYTLVLDTPSRTRTQVLQVVR